MSDRARPAGRLPGVALRAPDQGRAASTRPAGPSVMEPGLTYDASRQAPSYVLYRGGRAVARLEWRARFGAAAGWYLRRGARPARRLSVDVGLDALANEAHGDSGDWQDRALAAAALSTPFALDAADRALR